MIRPTLRLVRLELVVVAIMVLVLGSTMYWISSQIVSLGNALRSCGGTIGCVSLSNGLTSILNLVPAVQLSVPLVAGLVGVTLGSSVVAVEIEQRTAFFVWSLAPSRRRWLAEKASILGVACALLIAPLAWSALALGDAMVDVGFAPLAFNLTMTGTVVLGVTLVAFAAATAIGIFARRTMPTIAIASVATVVLVAALTSGFETWRSAEFVEATGRDDVIVLSVRYVDASGQARSFDEASQQADRLGVDFDSLFRQVGWGIPRSAVDAIAARELSAHLGLSSIFLAAAFIRIKSCRVDS